MSRGKKDKMGVGEIVDDILKDSIFKKWKKNMNNGQTNFDPKEEAMDRVKEAMKTIRRANQGRFIFSREHLVDSGELLISVIVRLIEEGGIEKVIGYEIGRGIKSIETKEMASSIRKYLIGGE